jgi:hypothetical protein
MANKNKYPAGWRKDIIGLRQLEAENKKLKEAIAKHRDQKGDDRCWLDDQELYSVLGDQVAQTALPSKEVFLGNCAKYFECRQNPAETYFSKENQTIKELQDKIEKYKELLSETLSHKDCKLAGNCLHGLAPFIEALLKDEDSCHCGKVHPNCDILHNSCNHDDTCKHHDNGSCTCNG